MIVDCIADLHGHYPKLEGGDLLIIAGDLTGRDTAEEYEEFQEWAIEQSHKYGDVIIVAGNHDNFLQDKPNFFDPAYITYLCDSGCSFTKGDKSIKIWGSPWTSRFKGINLRACAFTKSALESLQPKWDMIPDDTDILITHGPPYGILDKVNNQSRGHVGNVDLRNHVLTLPKIKLHVFGHIHERGGQIFSTPPCQFINCSYVNERYEPVNKAIRILL